MLYATEAPVSWITVAAIACLLIGVGGPMLVTHSTLPPFWRYTLLVGDVLFVLLGLLLIFLQ